VEQWCKNLYLVNSQWKMTQGLEGQNQAKMKKKFEESAKSS